jgi:hypothetical protein
VFPERTISKKQEIGIEILGFKSQHDIKHQDWQNAVHTSPKSKVPSMQDKRISSRSCNGF